MKTEKLKFDGLILQLQCNCIVCIILRSSNKACLILRIGNFGRFVGSFFAIKKEINILWLQF